MTVYLTTYDGKNIINYSILHRNRQLLKNIQHFRTVNESIPCSTFAAYFL